MGWEANALSRFTAPGSLGPNSLCYAFVFCCAPCYCAGALAVNSCDAGDDAGVDGVDAERRDPMEKKG